MYDIAAKHRVINEFNAVHRGWNGVNEENAAKRFSSGTSHIAT